jgi:hypothetical protein
LDESNLIGKHRPAAQTALSTSADYLAIANAHPKGITLRCGKMDAFSQQGIAGHCNPAIKPQCATARREMFFRTINNLLPMAT